MAAVVVKTPCACNCGNSGVASQMVVYHLNNGQKGFVLKPHLNYLHAKQTNPKAATGMQIVQSAGLRCVIGTYCGYRWRDRIVVLTPRIASGTDAESQVIAAHELTHSKQPHWWFWFLWLWPARLAIEQDAWCRLFGEAV